MKSLTKATTEQTSDKRPCLGNDEEGQLAAHSDVASNSSVSVSSLRDSVVGSRWMSPVGGRVIEGFWCPLRGGKW